MSQVTHHWRLYASFLSSKSPIPNATFLGISTKMYRTRRKITKYFSKTLLVPLKLDYQNSSGKNTYDSGDLQRSVHF